MYITSAHNETGMGCARNVADFHGGNIHYHVIRTRFQPVHRANSVTQLMTQMPDHEVELQARFACLFNDDTVLASYNQVK